MRATVLYVLGAYPLWSETFIRQDLRLLLGLGIPLKPVALYPGDVERHPDWPEVPCIDAGAEPEFAGGGSRSASPLSALGRLLPRYLYTKLSIVRHRRLRRSLLALSRTDGIRHIHAEFADLPAVLAASAAGSRGVTYSVSVHARDVHLAKFHPPSMFRRASFITACNTMALNAVLAACPRVLPKTHLIYHGLELEEWPFRFEERVPGMPLRLAFVGRFVSKKGLPFLFDALARLQSDGTEAELTLVGAGPLEEALRERAAALGIAEAIRWRGVVPREVVLEEVSQADALVVPSIVSPSGDRDGIPNVLLEAMALGTPVIGTQVGSLPEALTERTGWTVEAESADALADAIVRFQSAREETEERRREARALIEEKFNAAKLALERANLFDQLGLTAENP